MNNKCRVSKKLSSYLDNQLSQKERIEVENHIQKCEFCTKELVQLKLVSQKLKTWQPSGLDTSFDNLVRDKIVLRELERGQVKMKNKTLAILIPSGALAGILVLAFFGFLLKSGHKGELTSGLDEMGMYKQKMPAKVSTRSDVRVSHSTQEDSYNRGRHLSESAFWEKTRGTQGLFVGNKDYAKAGWGVDRDSILMEKGLGKEERALSFDAVDSLSRNIIIEPQETHYGGEGPVIVIQPTIPATGEGDKIIRTGFIRVEVENGKEAYNKALGICNELGGYMAGSNFYKTKEGKEAGTITMRIPKDKFTIALDKLSTLGKLENINTDSQDVSQEYANLKSQLDAAMVVYNKMLEALQKKNVTITDAVRLESELTPVLKRVEDLKNKIEYLNKSVAYTTVNFDFYESAVSFKTLKESRRFIQESMITVAIKAIKFIAVAIPTLIVAIVLFGIAAVVGLAVKQWIKQLLKRG